jgi:hypothetical protein
MARPDADAQWRDIAHTIRSGRHPKKADLAEALRSSLPPDDADLNRYFIAVLAGEIDRRGRPKNGWQRRNFEAHYLVRRVERLEFVYSSERRKRPAPKRVAFEKVAAEYGWAGGAKTAERKYWAAKKKWLPIGNPDPWVTRVMRHNRFGPFRSLGPIAQPQPAASPISATAMPKREDRSPRSVTVSWGVVGSLPTPVEVTVPGGGGRGSDHPDKKQI